MAALIDRLAARIGGGACRAPAAGHAHPGARGARRAGAGLSCRRHAGGLAGTRRERAAAAAVAAVRKARADQCDGDLARRSAAAVPLAARPMRWCAPKAPNASRWNGGAGRQTLTRDYFRVEDEEGRRFWIFRDGLFGSELADDEGEPVPAAGSCTGCSHERSAYAEIGVTTNFSFLRGGSHPRAYVHQAASSAFPPSASPTTTRWPAWCAPGRSSTIPSSHTSQNF